VQHIKISKLYKRNHKHPALLEEQSANVQLEKATSKSLTKGFRLTKN